MSAVNRAGLWFTIFGAAVVAGLVAHYDAEHIAPWSTVLLAGAALMIGMFALMHDQKPPSPNTTDNPK